MEIKVGEYIRTKDGNIQKVLKIQPYYENDKNRSEYDYMNTETFKQWKRYQFEEIVVKHSKNIIDLIGKDDYVNNHRIKDKWYDYGNECWHLVAEGNKHIFKEDIKTILTKEQYEQNSYKI